MTDEIMDDIEKLLEMTDVAKSEKLPVRREAKLRRVLKQWRAVTEHQRSLVAERDKILKKLDVGWDWFLTHKGHPAFTQREDQWLRWERKYVEIEQAIAYIESARTYALEAFDPVKRQEALVL